MFPVLTLCHLLNVLLNLLAIKNQKMRKSSQLTAKIVVLKIAKKKLTLVVLFQTFKRFLLDAFKIDFEKGKETFRPITIQDFNRFCKSWPDSSGIPISNFQIKGKDLRPVLCITNVKPEIKVEDMRNSFVRNFQLELENFQRLVKKNGRETTLITFQLTSDEQIKQAKHYGLTFEGIVYDIKEYVDREKKIIECSKCNKFGHLANGCKQLERCPRCNNPKTKCKGS